MEIVHYSPPSCAAAQFLFLFLKKKIGAVDAAPISAIKLPVAGFRRQAAGYFQNGNTCFENSKLFAVCVDNDSNLKKVWHCT